MAKGLQVTLVVAKTDVVDRYEDVAPLEAGSSCRTTWLYLVYTHTASTWYRDVSWRRDQCAIETQQRLLWQLLAIGSVTRAQE